MRDEYKLEERSTTIWIDLLCWHSIFLILRTIRSSKFYVLKYVNISHAFKPFFLFFEKFFGLRFEQVTGLSESGMRIQGYSVYEWVQKRLTLVLDLWVKNALNQSRIQKYCNQFNYHARKVEEHLKEYAYYKFFRIIETSALSESCGADQKHVFIFLASPYNHFYTREFHLKAFFYKRIRLFSSQVHRRKDYYYDRKLAEEYFGEGRSGWRKQFWSWLFDSINGSLSDLLVRPYRHQEKGRDQVKIAVELTQPRIRKDCLNDIQWFQSLNLCSSQLIGLAMESFDDVSLQQLEKTQVETFHNYWSPIHFIRQAWLHRKKRRLQMIDIGSQYCFIGPWTLMQIFFQSAQFRFKTRWMNLPLFSYRVRTEFWRQFYQKHQIKIVWTMYDVDPDKLSKAQAIEHVGGVYTGGHWSNFIMYRTDNQKCFDVVFTWSDHFKKQNFDRYPFLDCVNAGYFCDYYFEEHRDRAKRLRADYPDRFIISYHDNIMGYDLPYSIEDQIRIHQMFLDLMNQYDHLVLFLKPKRKFVLDQVLDVLPDLKEMEKRGRIRIFLGETDRVKAVPAMIGMASDLAVGLGISTAAAESYFAGTVAFHAEFMNLRHNAFADAGEGRCVFRTVDSLKEAIIRQIEDKKAETHESLKGIYEILDPFQDGLSNQRMGRYMEFLLRHLEQGLDRQTVVKETREKFQRWACEDSPDCYAKGTS